jgi:regulator of protease activity HflC (stomatin/prohibitin superfamily)
LHWKNPFIGTVIHINTRAVKVEDSATAATNDLQNVGVSIAVTYQITNEGVMQVYRQI